MSHSLPEYENPPVIETVLSAQFEPIDLTNALAGWYWKSVLGPEWASTQQVPRINEVFEKFGTEREWRSPQVQVHQKPTHDRLQISRDDSERMIQIQGTRFVYNWKKVEGSQYPTYKIILPEFEKYFTGFEEFVESNGLGEVKLNQWEVTYVNHIRNGDLWDSVTDWPEIIPSLQGMIDRPSVDGFASLVQEEIGDKDGRLHTDIKFGKTKADDQSEIILLQFTARGPVTKEVDLQSGFDLGHRMIVQTFDRITSESAHQYWKRKS